MWGYQQFIADWDYEIWFRLLLIGPPAEMTLPRGARNFLGDRKPRPKLRSATFRFDFGENQDNGPKYATLLRRAVVGWAGMRPTRSRHTVPAKSHRRPMQRGTKVETYFFLHCCEAQASARCAVTGGCTDSDNASDFPRLCRPHMARQSAHTLCKRYKEPRSRIA